MNLAAALEARALNGGWARDPAFAVEDRTFTHAEVHDGAARTASLLADLGVRGGDRVLIALPDGIEFAWIFLGAVRLGAVAVPVNPRLTVDDHRYLADDAAAGLVVCDTELAARFEGPPRRSGHAGHPGRSGHAGHPGRSGHAGHPGRSGHAGRPVLVAADIEGALAGYPPHAPAPVEADDAAYAQYTSGTTGQPKGAVHAHGHPPVYFEAFAGPAIALGRQDVVLSVSKLYFAYGLGNSLFFPLMAGCRAVLHPPHPRPDDVAELVHRHGVTVLFSVPTFYAHLVRLPDHQWTASMRVAVSAGESLTAGLAERAREAFGCPILDGIGSTEVGQTFASNTLAQWRDATAGIPLPPYRVAVRVDPGDLAPGSAGALWVSGPTLLLGYLSGAPAPVEDGWLATGDRASLDEDGYLHLHGRTDDMELVGGICVSPLEVEAVLVRHPAVTEVAVAGVVGSDGASRLCAYVVPGPGPVASADLETELVDMARAALAPFKVPKSFTFVDALPRTPTGKLRRFVLRQGWTKAPNRSV